MGKHSLTMSVEEVARLLGISRQLAYKGVRQGEIPAIRVGHRLLVPKAALERLLAEAGRSVVDPTKRGRSPTLVESLNQEEKR